MKKISILSLHLGYGGIEKSIIALANLLCEKYTVEIACTYCLYDKPAFVLDKRIKVKYLTKDIAPNKEEFNNALHSKKINRILQEGIKSVKILKIRKKTMVEYITKCNSDVIISSRDIFDDWLGEYGKESTLKIGWEHNHHHGDMAYADKITSYASKLDYFVLVSNDLKNYYQKRLKNSKCKCVYIPNIIDKLPKYASRLNKKRLVSIGRLSEEKGYLDLLKIYLLIQEKHSDWTLDIIGDGKEKATLEKFIKDNHLENKVTLHGFRNKDYIDEILHQSSIYLMTSYTESFGIVLIEAMSHGIPCIAFDSAEGARELITNKENGYLISDRNFTSYANKVSELIEQQEERIQLGKKARESVKKYTGESVIKMWYSIIEKE